MTSAPSAARTPLLEVPDDDPFRHDRLGHKEPVLRLRRLLQRTPGPFVLALHAEWGLGKTTFLRMLRAQLASEQVVCVWFDAWKNDFSESPLVAMVSELEAQTRGDRTDLQQQLKQAATEAAKWVTPAGLFKIGKAVSVAAFSAVGVNVPQAVADAGAVLADAAEHQLDDALARHDAQRRSLAHFKAALERYAQATTPRTGPGLVVFIDELDRCRPDYAIRVLETVKHLFDVPGVVFVLGVHLRELAHAVGALYGERFDGQRYLRRFVDVQFDLAPPSLKAYAEVNLAALLGSALVFDALHWGQAYRDRDGTVPYTEPAAAMLWRMARGLRWTARDVEQVGNKLATVLSMADDPLRLEPLLLTFCVGCLYEDAELRTHFAEKNFAALRLKFQDLAKTFPDAETDPIWTLLRIQLERAQADDQAVWTAQHKNNLHKTLAKGVTAKSGAAVRQSLAFLDADARHFLPLWALADLALLTTQIDVPASRQLESTRAAGA